MQTEDLYIHHCDHANDQNHVLGHWQGTQGVVSCAWYNDDDDDDDDDDAGDDDDDDDYDDDDDDACALAISTLAKH